MKGTQILKTTLIENPDAEQLKKWIESFQTLNSTRFEQLRSYFLGEQEIESRTMNVTNLANNKITTNWCEFITNTLTGYFVGVPPQLVTKDDKVQEAIEEFDRSTKAWEKDYAMCKQGSIYGNSYALMYVDTTTTPSTLNYEVCDVQQTFLVYDVNSISEKPFGAVRFFQTKIDNKEKIKVYYYDQFNVYEYILEDKTLLSAAPHNVGKIPIIEFKNNAERKGDFESVLSLQDAYNMLSSDRVNNVANVTNALLVLVNYNVSTSDAMKKFKEAMKKNGVVCVDDKGDAKYISNQLNDSTVVNLREAIKEDLLTISCTPDMTSDKFGGNLSGVAMRYKLYNTDQKVGDKRRGFKSTLYNRLEIMSLYPGTPAFVWRDVDVVFTNNLPQNELEIIEIGTKLSGTVSNKTKLNFIKDAVGFESVEDELAQIEKENVGSTEAVVEKEVI